MGIYNKVINMGIYKSDLDFFVKTIHLQDSILTCWMCYFAS